jgi:putative transposase
LLSKLAVWWLRLGIQIERIRPGHPEQNGPHERRHLTLKRDATKPAAPNVLQQQARFDDFVTRYNTDRPHLLQNDAWGSWQTPEEILLARFFKFSVQWDF